MMVSINVNPKEYSEKYCSEPVNKEQNGFTKNFAKNDI